MTEFTPIDVGVVNAARIDAKHEANERRERMPSSAAALDQRAEQLLVVRNKLLDLLPEKFHEHRKAYPDYKPSLMGFAVRVTESQSPDAIGLELPLTDRPN